MRKKSKYADRLTPDDIEHALKALSVRKVRITAETLHAELGRGGLGTISNWLKQRRKLLLEKFLQETQSDKQAGGLEELVEVRAVVNVTRLKRSLAEQPSAVRHVAELNGYVVRHGEIALILPDEVFSFINKPAAGH